jgi:diguanylate cyclase (GGDEF)-like protein/PAS domain S-box-containing protein
MILLLLVVVVFAVHQRRRPHLYFRFWVVGWFSIFLAYGLWQFQLGPGNLDLWRDALRYDLVMAGGLLFSFSFLVTRQTLKKTLLICAVILAVASTAIDLQLFEALRPQLLRPLLMALIVVAHVVAILKARMNLHQHKDWSLAVVQVMVVLFGITMLTMVYRNPHALLANITLCEVFGCAALMHAGSYRRISIVNVMGTVGLGSWAVFYLFPDPLKYYHHAAALQLLYSVWNLPKYLLGMYMILKIVEEERDENNTLATQYRTLYDELRLMYENHPHPMWVYDLETKLFLTSNKAARKTYGYSNEEFQRMQVDELEAPHDDQTDFAVLESIPLPAGGRRLRHRRKDGSTLWVHVNGHEIVYEDTKAYYLTARDVTQILQFEHQLLHRARHDELTGLPTRSLLKDRMEQALERSIRDDKKTAVLTIDIDHFKQINDTYGHAAGDACLKAVAERLSSKIRSVDTMARTGGEEFVAVIGGLQSASNAELIAKALLGLFNEPVQLPERELAVTVSIGIAIFPDDAYDCETLKKRSDEAMYAAKRAGRNRFVAAGMLQAEEPRRTQLLPG